MAIGDRPVGSNGPVHVWSAVGRGDDGDVHAILHRRVHTTHVVRRGRIHRSTIDDRLGRDKD